MKKIIFILIMIISGSVAYCGYSYDIDQYRQQIETNKDIDSIEKIDYLEKRIILSGVVIKGIRVHKIETNFVIKTSEATLMKDDLTEAFKKKNKDIKTIEVKMEKDNIICDGDVVLLGVLMKVHLEGMFYINEKQEIEYEIKKAVVNGFISVPETILNGFRERINPVFRLNKLGIPVYLSKVILGTDRIILR